MKRLGACLTLGVLAASPACLRDNRPQAEIVGPVNVALDDWHAAAAAADEERYFSHFADDAVFLGTDAKERWTVAEFKAYAHPHFAAKKAWTMHASRRAVTVREPYAWFDEDLTTEKLGPARGSGVLVKDRDLNWKIVQYNLALTIPNEKLPAVRALLDGAPSASGSPAASSAPAIPDVAPR